MLQQHLKHLDELFHDSSAVTMCWPGEDVAAASVLARIPGACQSAALRTQFHRREKPMHAAISDW